MRPGRLPLCAAVFALSVLPAVGAAQPTAPACPCTSYGPYPCAATTLVALADEAEALGLTEAQLDEVLALRAVYVHEVAEVLSEIGALHAALGDLGRPAKTAEVFALYYDLGRHYAELEGAFEDAEAAVLAVLDDRQRGRWAELMAEAASYQEAPVACDDDSGL